MKIALIYYRMMLRAGGLESRLRSYLFEMTRRGHDVTLLMARPRNLVLPQGATLQRLPRGPLPKSLQPIGFNAALGGWMRRHDYDFSLSLERSSHQDAVLNPGNHLGYLRAEGRKPSTLSDWAQIRLDRLAYRDSKIIFAASPMMKAETIELYDVSPDNIVVLPPPVLSDRFQPLSEEKRHELRQEWGIRPDEIACAFVSASHLRKGLPLLLEVFKALRGKPFRLLVAGNPLPPEASGLENVTWIGHSSEPEKLFAACDVSLLPARYEPFGQVVTESILCGTPAFVSDRVGAAPYLSEAEGLVLPFDTADAWIAALEAFAPATYSPGHHFALRHGLDLSSHVDQLLEGW
ncbi:MAG: glycosyltransferase family 4 protein [Bacteroidia bacterium]|nr:glycosyltransferase family 4 protein [Bacteroidia bacterium]